MNIHIFQNKENLTTRLLRIALENRGHTVTTNNYLYFDTTHPEKFDVSGIDLVYYWNSAGITGRMCLLDYLKAHKIPFVNRLFLEDLRALNKITQTYVVAKNNIRTPKTIVQKEASYDRLLELLGTPFVMKAAFGSRGKKVYLIKSEEEYDSARQTMSGCELLYQQFIPNDGDFRIHVVGGKAVCAYKRVPLGDSFKANVSQGGSMEKVTDAALLQQIFLMAEKVAASFIGCEIVGVDLMRDKNTGDLYFIETNEIPGTKQVKEVTGVDISDVMAEYFESVVRNQNVLG